MSHQTVVPLPPQGLTSRIARALRGLLAERQISGNRLAHETGLSQSRISRRLTGEYPLDTDELETILTFVGVSLDELLGRVAEGPRPDGPDGGEECAIRDSNPEPADYEPQPSAEVIPLAPRRDRSAPLTAPASTPEPLRVAS